VQEVIFTMVAFDWPRVSGMLPESDPAGPKWGGLVSLRQQRAADVWWDFLESCWNEAPAASRSTNVFMLIQAGPVSLWVEN
jgi:hypothetical protein